MKTPLSEHPAPQPVLEYRTPIQRVRKPVNQVKVGVWIVLGSVLLGMMGVRDKGNPLSFLGCLGVLAGGGWYITARQLRQKDIRFIWRIFGVLVALECMIAGVGAAMAIGYDGLKFLLHRDWEYCWNYSRDIRAAIIFLAYGVGAFAIVKLAAWIDRNINRQIAQPVSP